uniref:Uncharacterized protein n=1 Tax=Rhodosorus marinus TaxID=101924 RepID=A0A7S3E7T7_9RHOD|mmetsp:Transcript_15751/g.64364  ORF Transcript_15751/g.64364 Transcript_15751/m.64364 type:complete len:180 (+) Transcript_15751:115-654(+)
MAFLFHGIARLNQVIRGGGGGRGELENGDASSESGRSVDSIRLEEEKALRISEQKELDGKVSSLLEKPGSIKSLVQTLSRLKFQIPPEQSLALFQTLSSCLLQTVCSCFPQQLHRETSVHSLADPPMFHNPICIGCPRVDCVGGGRQDYAGHEIEEERVLCFFGSDILWADKSLPIHCI